MPDDLGGTASICQSCGGQVSSDGYCGTCGARAPRLRDHFSEQPAAWVAAVCDRGIRHTRNEDAVALAADPEPGSRAVLVVCDGVSNSIDSDVASLAAARAARDVLGSSRSRGMGTPVLTGRRRDRTPRGGDRRRKRGRARGLGERQRRCGSGQSWSRQSWSRQSWSGQSGLLHVRRRSGGAGPARGRVGGRQPGLLAPLMPARRTADPRRPLCPGTSFCVRVPRVDAAQSLCPSRTPSRDGSGSTRRTTRRRQPP